MRTKEALEILQKMSFTIISPSLSIEDSRKAFDVVVREVKMRIPKKIREKHWHDTVCECGYIFSTEYRDGYYAVTEEKKTSYCPSCGQALKWIKD